MKSIASLSLLILGTSLAVMLCNRPAESQGQQQPTLHERIDKLLVERRDTLRQLHDEVAARYLAGGTTVDSVLRAQDALLDAELDLAKKQIERIRVHEKRVKNLRELENAVKQQHSAGICTIEKVLAIKADRIRAEVELLREQVPTD